MSTAARPPRRLPSRVYWRRRLVLVAMLALVLAAVWQTRVNRADETQPAAADGQPNAQVAESAESAPGSSDKVSARRFAAAAAVGAAVSTHPAQFAAGRAASPSVRPVLADPVGRCDPTATVARADAPEPVVSGAGATLQVRVSTTASEACTLVLTDRLLVQIARADEAIWRLQDCPSALATESVVVQPTWSTVIDITWSGRVSSAKCGLETADVAPGGYSLQAAILSGEPGTAELDVIAAERQGRKHRQAG